MLVQVEGSLFTARLGAYQAVQVFDADGRHGIAAADEVWRWDVVLVACPRDLTGAEVELEHADGVRVLVGDDHPLARSVELKVPRGGSPGVLQPGRQQKPSFLVHRVHANAVMPAVGHDDEAPKVVDVQPPARVHVLRKPVGDRADNLGQHQTGLAPDHAFLPPDL